MQNLLERLLAVDGARIDGEAGVFGGKALVGLREAEIVAHEIHQIGGIAAIVDGESRRKANRFRIFAQKPRTDGVECAGPGIEPVIVSAIAVPPLCTAPARMRPTRRVISTDARREKVNSMMRRGSAPRSIRCATRCAKVEVLPEPAPAMMSSGPASAGNEPPCSTARRCCGLRFSRLAPAFSGLPRPARAGRKRLPSKIAALCRSTRRPRARPN